MHKASSGIHMVTRPPTPACLSLRQNTLSLYSAQVVPVQRHPRVTSHQTASFSSLCIPLSRTRHSQAVCCSHPALFPTRLIFFLLRLAVRGLWRCTRTVQSPPRIHRTDHYPARRLPLRVHYAAQSLGLGVFLLFFLYLGHTSDTRSSWDFIDILNGLALDTTHKYQGRLPFSSSCRTFYMASPVTPSYRPTFVV